MKWHSLAGLVRLGCRFVALAEGWFDSGHDPESSEREVGQATWKPDKDLVGTSSPHPLALCLAATSGVMSAYRSAALVGNYKRCDWFREDAQGQVLTASLSMISICRTWSTNRNLRILRLNG